MKYNKGDSFKVGSALIFEVEEVIGDQNMPVYVCQTYNNGVKSRKPLHRTEKDLDSLREITKFVHPETGKEYLEHFLAFSVHSDRLCALNPNMYSVLKCYHSDYDVAKKVFDEEVELQKNATNEFSKSVQMVYNTRLGFTMEGLIVHKWKNY